MQVIPAIDIREGRVVRLYRGLYNRQTVYSNDPAEVAKRWKDEGANILHVIDLDGAIYGSPKNLKSVIEIVKQGVFVHLGGGLRSKETIEMAFKMGVNKVIISTKVFEDDKFLGSFKKDELERIIVSVDSKAGIVLDKGWINLTKLSVNEAIEKIEKIGIKFAVVTDISCDGTLHGLNISLLEEVLAITKMKIIASGGIANLDDIKTLCRLTHTYKNLFGVITGKALYEGKLKLKEAIDCGNKKAKN